MSDSMEVLEITDTSLAVDTLAEIKDKEIVAAAPEIIETTTTNTKRHLEDDGDEEENAAKKVRSEVEGAEEIETDVNEPEGLSVLEKNISEVPEEVEDEVLDKTIETIEDEDMLEERASQEIEDEEEEIGEESFDCQEEVEEEEELEEEEEGTSDDDEEMMARAIQSAKVVKPPAKVFQIANDEPIALDDTDEDEDETLNDTANYKSDSDEFSVDNNVIGESDEEAEEIKEMLRLRSVQIANKANLVMAKRILKKSRKNFLKKRVEREKIEEGEASHSAQEAGKEVENKENQDNRGKLGENSEMSRENNESLTANREKADEDSELSCKTGENLAQSEENSGKLAENREIREKTMENLESSRKTIENSGNFVENQKIAAGNSEISTKINENLVKLSEKSVKTPENQENSLENHENLQKINSKTPQIVSKTEENKPEVDPEPMEITENQEVPSQNPQKPKDDLPPATESSINLLAEIQNSPIDEIFNRYVLKTSENSPSLDEFNEELFFCLQQNKLEIEKATQLWNEKLHVKYKIRELMETIRRHRAVMEIETFGKPTGNHPVISSKSSTTTNSEADNYEKQMRMSTESVTRLIQDVRASMLKRDEKQEESFNSVQQGRQGQIIDVQSIINDFRQKNPQEIPRRGRRMKSSFGYDNQTNDFSSNGHEFNSTVKSNASGSGGYPEVSLHPVHTLYKKLGYSQAGPHFSGEPKASLLQSILTKQSTKSPTAAGFHPNHSLPSTSTLARLLTAPERSIHGAPKQSATPPAQHRQSSTKVHNNGEITITPIGHNNNSRNKDYSMDDEDNSMEPPLVIDESEDFDATGKSVTDLLCQGCKKNKAFFMCAGCSRQWYCSKECQEMAWDEHAEDCMI